MLVFMKGFRGNITIDDWCVVTKITKFYGSKAHLS